MALASGARLGPYEIQSPLGAGGMGEVYRARDTRLNRDVAIKVLPAAFSRDPERLPFSAQTIFADTALPSWGTVNCHTTSSPSQRPRPFSTGMLLR